VGKARTASGAVAVQVVTKVYGELTVDHPRHARVSSSGTLAFA